MALPQQTVGANDDPMWTELRPKLDDAMANLASKDRDAVVQHDLHPRSGAGVDEGPLPPLRGGAHVAARVDHPRTHLVSDAHRLRHGSPRADHERGAEPPQLMSIVKRDHRVRENAKALGYSVE